MLNATTTSQKQQNERPAEGDCYPAATADSLGSWSAFEQVRRFDMHGDEPKTKRDAYEQFLRSTMDEMRLRRAGEISKGILLARRLEAARHFRRGVLRRELSREVSYDGQRDHDAHTLNLYLLGFWFYEHVPAVRETLKKHAGERGLISESADDKDDKEELNQLFGRLWTYTSLLHDIGYLFEGNLEQLDVAMQSEHAKLGANVVSEFFAATFWRECEAMQSTDSQRRLREMSDVKLPNIDGSGLQSLIDSIRYVGDLSNIPDFTENSPRDAFDLWQLNYEELESEKKKRKARDKKRNKIDEKRKADGLSEEWANDKKTKLPMLMSERIERLERITYQLIENGIPGSGVRVLDHAVMGGLLQLLWRSTFSRLYFGVVDEIEDEKAVEKYQDQVNRDTRLQFEFAWRLWKRQKKGDASEEYEPDRAGYERRNQLKGVIWASAATALHNIQQMNNGELKNAFGTFYTMPNLKLKDDPLAYLGVLADILQEWDRYRVTPGLSGKAPLEGHRVRIAAKDGRVWLRYPKDPDRNWSEKVIKALDESLDGWRDLVDIEVVE